MSDGLEETFFASLKEAKMKKEKQLFSGLLPHGACDAMRECNATWLDASETAAHNNGDEAAKEKSRRVT